MALPKYRDPIIKAVVDLLEPNADSRLKGHYYYGDVLLVPKSMLPICSVSIDTEAVTTVNSLEDESKVPLVINVLTDWNDQGGKDFDLQSGTNMLYEIIAARNDDFTFRADSMLGLLRSAQGVQPVQNQKIYLGIDDDRIAGVRLHRCRSARAGDGRRDDVHGRRADEAGDEQIVGRMIEFHRRTDLLDHAEVEHHDAVGERHRLHLIVRHVDHGRVGHPLV